MRSISALFSGLVFGVGLLLAGMANPAKVLAFLDLGGKWDPSLALVMVGAIAVATIGFSIAKRRDRSLLGMEMQLPKTTQIDRRLLLGSLGFGVGWGLVGICPGPALALLGTGSIKAVVFVLAMLLGMGVFSLLERARK
jgi:uncharacterized protein